MLLDGPIFAPAVAREVASIARELLAGCLIVDIGPNVRFSCETPDLT